MFISLVVLPTINKQIYESYLCLMNHNLHLSYHRKGNSYVCDTRVCNCTYSAIYCVSYVMLFIITDTFSIYKLVIILHLKIGLCETSKFMCLCVKNTNHLSHHKEEKPSMYFISINIYCVIFVLLFFKTNTFSIFKFVKIYSLIFTLCKLSESIQKPFACTECDSECLCVKNPNLHLRNHTGEKPFMCLILNNIYTHSASCCSEFESYFLLIDTDLYYYLMKIMFQCVVTNPNRDCKCFEHIYKLVIILYLKIVLGDLNKSILNLFACSECSYRCICDKNINFHYSHHTGEKPLMRLMSLIFIYIYNHSVSYCGELELHISLINTDLCHSLVKMIISCVISNSNSVCKCFEYIYKCISSCFHTGGKSYLCVTDYYHEYYILMYYLHTDGSNLLLCDRGIYILNPVQYKLYLIHFAQLVKYYIYSLILSKQKKSLFRILIKNG